MSTLFSVAIDLIGFKLGGNMAMHNILHEFEFRPDTTTDNEAIFTCWLSCESDC